MGTKSSVTLGLDIGGTKLKGIALKGRTQILKEISIPSRANEGPNEVRSAIKDAIKLFQEAEIPFSSIGIGCAGSVDHHRGVVRNSPNFADWKNIPLKDWVELDFNVPVSVENDAKCAVFAEWKVGAGEGHKNVVLLTLGTGIGGGLILDGRLFRGATGTAGELGHFSIHTEGLPCPCGNRGCFERYCSATAVKNQANGISPKDVFSKAGIVPEYKKIIDEFIYNFQIALVGIANVFDPEIILLGGAVTDGLSIYLEEISH
ncbi:MAG: ROK family protein, partial [Proteobacteria bacterium]|nr:ROK family protein [Pseudomonadota bacterium]NDD03972.1 ROK family protein [Pseudomonadota bacterium]